MRLKRGEKMARLTLQTFASFLVKTPVCVTMYDTDGTKKIEISYNSNDFTVSFNHYSEGYFVYNVYTTPKAKQYTTVNSVKTLEEAVMHINEIMKNKD